MTIGGEGQRGRRNSQSGDAERLRAVSKLSERFARRAEERRVLANGQIDRRQRGRGGRRRTDRGRPSWQKGLFFGAVLAILRWRFFPPDRS